MGLLDVASVLVGAGGRIADGQTPLQQTSDLVWVMVAIGAAGAIVTFGFLVYALVRFRDPKTRRRRYG